MPPSRVGHTGHRRLRLDKMRSRGQAEQVRNPSPDIEEDEDLRREHFSYYNLMYSPRKPKPENKEAVLFRDPFQEDRRNQSQVALTIRRRRTSSPSPTLKSPTSLPIRGPSMSGRSSAGETPSLGRIAQTPVGGFRETRKRTEPDLQSPTHRNQSDTFGGNQHQENDGVRVLMTRLGEVTLRPGHGVESNPVGATISSRRGAIDFRGVPSVEQLSRALKSDLRLLEQPENERGELAPQNQQVMNEGHKLNQRKEQEQNEEEEDVCI